jgi:hypothetical protein
MGVNVKRDIKKMKVKILIFIALAILFIGASCQSTPTKQKATTKAGAKPASKPKSDYTSTKKSGGGTTKKPQVGTTKKENTKAGEKTTSGPKLKAGAATPPVFTPPPIPPVYTCDNITGIASFRFADFATGQWYLHREMCAFPFNPWFGTCGIGNFTLDAAKTSSSLVVNTFLEGTYQTSPASKLTPVGTNGIMTWAITTVGVRNDTMPSTSTLKVSLLIFVNFFIPF